MTRIILRKNEDARILAGHPWIYDNEIDRMEGDAAPGDTVDVESSRKEYLGRGFYNPSSKIRVRLISRSKDGIDAGFLKRRLRDALALRERFCDTGHDSFRLAFGEADFLPGLIIDVYTGRPATPAGEPAEAAGPRHYVSLQTLSYGMDRFKPDIIRILGEILDPAAIVERNDVSVRALEGLPEEKGIVAGSLPGEIEIDEHGIRILVDLVGGQKTGYFLDQRENRAALQPFVRDAEVLDAFCHTGGFALHAAKYGAVNVVAADISETATAAVARNAALNGFSERIQPVTANVFDLLREYEHAKRRFGAIVLDPPAFTKTRATVEDAYRGYKDINLKAMKLIGRGGFLVTCSCSHYFGPERFTAMLKDAARDADRPVRIIEQRFQAKDHPVLAGYDESLYLKCIIAQVL